MTKQVLKKYGRKKGRANLLFKLIMLALFLLGLLTFSYPFLADAINDFHDQLTIEKFQKDYSSLTVRQKEKSQKEMREKNKALLKENKLMNIPGMGLVKDPFEEATKDTKNPGKAYFENHMIGAIFIPKIKVSLPIFDETNNVLLDKGATVLQGTSFPIGGAGTHSALTGHSGLPEKKIFTDLNQLKKGDIFYINVSGKKLAYRINRFETVLPDNINHLKVVDGLDQVTLVTCTPYMINTHRLLVTGIRTTYKEEKLEKEIKVTKNYHLYRIILFSVLIILITAISAYVIWRIMVSYLKQKENN